ncbi:hypothetical protein LTR48_004043 [Friedmanniomyces endolithicus]|uniref:Uncharacterized protein n=1 Tax=Friedmanniomyces endolithicus TaxID=329885 RepID=A0A4U0VBJ9_9PEZI|nr:hypothetical protein LTS09_004170 [Friedmanniomyces endolithicus]KAK0934463.1 hypothetical protein LTR29_013933 [Friedmanniomyces endolithicus]KAK1092586.1 hypothetical protein LTR48_004043 [Friedmanniomyces endolithicus]KAK1822895.1 hypothetical protein LTR12_002617 [Friedmanniomyces endolithicus]TKA45942.1 hypothetical protein B0A54_03627 [Friedmanniomyces endolithicus]
MPDVNSLPDSPTTASATPTTPTITPQPPRRISLHNADSFRNSPPSPRSPPLSSLQAAATINRGLHRTPSNNSPIHNIERRRSSLMNNLSINDPTMPAPGELQQSNSNGSSPRSARRSTALATADPNHHRQPSLGELHQELESEQEAQVNRLLQMIRIQQEQLATLQRQQQQQQQHPPSEPSPTFTEQTHFPTPPSTLPTPASTNTPEQSSPRSVSLSNGLPQHAPAHAHFNRPHSLSRQSSARLSNAGTSSRSGSPALRPVSANLGPLTEDFLPGGTRDECAFYQAETQTLTRENRMLKARIRELERQVTDMSHPPTTHNGNSTASSGLAHSPAQNSPLACPPATSSSPEAPARSGAVDPTAAAKVD